LILLSSYDTSSSLPIRLPGKMPSRDFTLVATRGLAGLAPDGGGRAAASGWLEKCKSDLARACGQYSRERWWWCVSPVEVGGRKVF